LQCGSRRRFVALGGFYSKSAISARDSADFSFHIVVLS
jgi:hypothetical protein